MGHSTKRDGHIPAKSTEFDALLGQSIRRLRVDANMTQQELAKACGISFQQIQKYEQGVNRIAAFRLLQIARALNVPVAQIFSMNEEPHVCREEQPLESRLLTAALKIEPTNLGNLVQVAERIADADTNRPADSFSQRRQQLLRNRSRASGE